MATLKEQFLAEIQGFLDRSGMKRSRFGQDAFKDPTFVFDLEKGRIPSLDTVERARAFISAYEARSESEAA